MLDSLRINVKQFRFLDATLSVNSHVALKCGRYRKNPFRLAYVQASTKPIHTNARVPFYKLS